MNFPSSEHYIITRNNGLIDLGKPKRSCNDGCVCFTHTDKQGLHVRVARIEGDSITLHATTTLNVTKGNVGGDWLRGFANIMMLPIHEIRLNMNVKHYPVADASPKLRSVLNAGKVRVLDEDQLRNAQLYEPLLTKDA